MVDMEGWLEKSSAGHKRGGLRGSIGNMRSNWDRRYFVLSGRTLRYFKSEADAKKRAPRAQGSFACEGAQLECFMDGSFALVSKDRELSLRVNDRVGDIKERWVAALETARESAAEKVAREAHEKAAQQQRFQILSALLLLGNVEYTEDDDEKCCIADNGPVEAVDAIIKAGPLYTNLTSRKMTRGKGAAADKRQSVYTIDYNKRQADMTRDSVIKAVYTHLFDWVVDRVNAFTSRIEGAQKLPYVGLLDIFGFENFKWNFHTRCIHH